MSCVVFVVVYNDFADEDKSILMKAFEGSDCVQIKAVLKGGKGECAWQHTQLFRQSISNCKDYPFRVIINFRNK